MNEVLSFISNFIEERGLEVEGDISKSHMQKDLEMDSLEMTGLLVALRSEYNVIVDIDDFIEQELIIVGNLVNYISEKK